MLDRFVKSLFGSGQDARDDSAPPSSGEVPPKEGAEDEGLSPAHDREPESGAESSSPDRAFFPAGEGEIPLSFACSVTGASHLRKGTPCQDASAVYAEPRGLYHIAVVSDGHGDSTCVRSDRGSAFAVESTLENLKIFAGSLTEEESRLAEILPTSKHEDMVVRKLTDAILYGWRTRVLADLEKEPLTEEELTAAGRYADRYRKGERLEHAYGATLIAALWTRDQLLMIQQGDGQLDLILADDTVQTPVPWDDRCYANVTTSICDPDAADSFRHLLLDLREVPVIACCIGSDGVEDSFGSPEGRHQFYRQILAAAVDPARKETFPEDLKETLQDLTAKGSGDDTSAAVLYMETAVRAAAETFIREADSYFSGEELSLLKSRLGSMSRKHEALAQKAGEARMRAEEARKGFLRSKTLLEDAESLEEAARRELEAYEAGEAAIRERIRQLEGAPDPVPGEGSDSEE